MRKCQPVLVPGPLGIKLHSSSSGSVSDIAIQRPSFSTSKHADIGSLTHTQTTPSSYRLFPYLVQHSTLSCISLACITFSIDHGFYSSYLGHLIGWAVCAVLAIMSTAISFLLMYRHAKNYTKVTAIRSCFSYSLDYKYNLSRYSSGNPPLRLFFS